MTDAPLSLPVSLPLPRAVPDRGYGALNGRGLWTLWAKETDRFLKIWSQTLIAPAVLTLLFFAVFGVSLGSGGQATVGGTPFLTWLLPGLVIMTLAQSAFTSPAAALVLSKIQGSIVDLVMAPLSPLEWTLGFVLSGVVRGALVGILTTFVLFLFHPVAFVDGGFVLYHALMGALMLSLLGYITGLLSDKFDQMATVQNFIVMPATFLSGTFFPLSALPAFWQKVCLANPFFYMIDGFRYGFTGVAEGPLTAGVCVMLGADLALFAVACFVTARADQLRN